MSRSSSDRHDHERLPERAIRSIATNALRPSRPDHSSAPRRSACARSLTAPPPTKIGTPRSAWRSAFTTARTAASPPGVVIAITDRDQAVGLARGLRERGRRGVGSHVEDLEPDPSQQIGEDRRRERMLLPHGRADHDRASLAASASEPGPEPTDQAERDRSRPMLVRDGELAGCPPIPHHLERRHQKVEVDVRRLDARRHRRLDNSPCPGLVARHHARSELPWPLRPNHAVPPRCALGRSHLRELRGIDHPLHALASGREPTGADVSIRRHVVHSETVGCLLKSDRSPLSGHRALFTTKCRASCGISAPSDTLVLNTTRRCKCESSSY